MKKSISDIASFITLYFIGYMSQSEFNNDILTSIDENLENNVDYNKDCEKIKKHCEQLIPEIIINENSSINPIQYMHEKFRYHRGSFEKEHQAVLSELSFWYKEKN